jgi:hypothetical protein
LKLLNPPPSPTVFEGEGRSPITDGIKLPVINALYGAITVDKEIDLEEG